MGQIVGTFREIKCFLLNPSRVRDWFISKNIQFCLGLS